MSVEIQVCLAVPTGHSVVDAPIGRWWLEWCSRGLLAVSYTDARPGGDEFPNWLNEAWSAFWSGKNYNLTLITPRPVSPFFIKVYEQLARVLQGDTMSYRDLARLCGCPGGARAVGQAMRMNPWPLFLPCHRIVSSTGALAGYIGKKHVEIKAQLLEYEQRMRGLSEAISSCVSGAMSRLGVFK